MARKESSKAGLCRDFLAENPLGTFKDFAAANPDTDVTASYFATLKSNLKKKEESGEEVEDKPKKTPPKRTPPPKAPQEAAATNGRKKRGPNKPKVAKTDLGTKLESMKGFLAWVEEGQEKGYVAKLKENL